MAKYNIGDKVHVRDDLKCGRYGKNSVVESMLELKGKDVTIEEHLFNGQYGIKEDQFIWTDEMFSGLAKPNTKKYYPKSKGEPFHLHVGDKVRVKNTLTFANTGISNIHQYINKVLTVSEEPDDYPIKLNDGGFGWNWDINWLEPVTTCSKYKAPVKSSVMKPMDYSRKPEMISDRLVITSDGTKTVARFYHNGKLVKEGAAVRSYEDEPCFGVGAYHAAQRANVDIMSDKEKHEKKPEPSYYNGKVVCVNNCDASERYTVGKIYEIKDGILTNDLGVAYRHSPVHSFDEWNNWSAAEWLEIKE